MSITTKTGDKGETRLYSGQTVSKRSPRICICGDIDELVSILGVAKQYTDKAYDKIEWVQEQLFKVASEIATIKSKVKITDIDVEALDRIRISIELSVTMPKGFILPGSNQASAYVDWARAVSRRCERGIVDAYNEKIIDNKNILIWMNRLSDYLYLLARYVEKTPQLVKRQGK